MSLLYVCIMDMNVLLYIMYIGAIHLLCIVCVCMYVLYICMYGIYMHVYVYNTYVLYICMWFSSMCVCVCVG